MQLEITLLDRSPKVCAEDVATRLAQLLQVADVDYDLAVISNKIVVEGGFTLEDFMSGLDRFLIKANLLVDIKCRELNGN